MALAIETAMPTPPVPGPTSLASGTAPRNPMSFLAAIAASENFANPVAANLTGITPGVASGLASGITSGVSSGIAPEVAPAPTSIRKAGAKAGSANAQTGPDLPAATPCSSVLPEVPIAALAIFDPTLPSSSVENPGAVSSLAQPLSPASPCTNCASLTPDGVSATPFTGDSGILAPRSITPSIQAPLLTANPPASGQRPNFVAASQSRVQTSTVAPGFQAGGISQEPPVESVGEIRSAVCFSAFVQDPAPLPETSGLPQPSIPLGKSDPIGTGTSAATGGADSTEATAATPRDIPDSPATHSFRTLDLNPANTPAEDNPLVGAKVLFDAPNIDLGRLQPEIVTNPKGPRVTPEVAAKTESSVPGSTQAAPAGGATGAGFQFPAQLVVTAWPQAALRFSENGPASHLQNSDKISPQNNASHDPGQKASASENSADAGPAAGSPPPAKDSSSSAPAGNPATSMHHATVVTAPQGSVAQPDAPQATPSGVPDPGVPQTAAQVAGSGAGVKTNSNQLPPDARSTVNVADSAPMPVAGPAQMAQLVSRAAQSEMRIGLNTSSFGSVEVHTVVQANDVGILIGSEKGDLRSLLAAEMPGIATSLQQQNLRLNQVVFHEGSGFSGNPSSGGDSQPRYFTPSRVASSAPGEFRAGDSVGVGNETASYSSSGLNILA